MYDIGIIGGGTAGMTAAIYGQRAGKRTIIIEGGTFGGQITSSPNVENYPGIASVSGSEFSMNLLDQAMKLGAETQMAQVTGIRDEGEVKVIVTPEKEYPCRSIVLATGVTHRHLGVPNEERLTGAGVSYCATCDGMFFRGKEVAVVGGGNTAIQDAEFLSDYCSKVYLHFRICRYLNSAENHTCYCTNFSFFYFTDRNRSFKNLKSFRIITNQIFNCIYSDFLKQFFCLFSDSF